MKEVMVDTDILSLFFRSHEKIVSKFRGYISRYDKINLSIITFYEILSGLKHRDASKQLDAFIEFTIHNTLLPIIVIERQIDLHYTIRK